MTQDTERGDVDPLLAGLSTGDVPSRRAAARALAAADVRGREQAVLDAFDAAADDAVKLWIAVALARAGQEVGLEELFGRWREDPDRPLSDAYPDLAAFARELAPVLPLAPSATQLLESYARIQNTWIGELAQMLLGRWSPPEQAAVARERPRPGGRTSRAEPDHFGRDSHATEARAGGRERFDAVGAEGPDVFAEAPFEGTSEAAPPPPVPSPRPSPAPAAPPSSPAPEAAPPPESAPPPAPGEPPAAAEPVLLGGSAPRRAAPGDTVLVQLSAYIAAFAPTAREELERSAAEGDEIRMGQETDCRWARGVRVSVRCRANGLVIAEPLQQFIWDGECRTVQFDVAVPADARPQKTVIVLEAFVHDREEAPDAVQVARLRLPMEIAAGAPAAAEPVETVRTTAAKTAFASYASQDRVDVLERVSSIRRSTGLEVFVDVVDLRVGDQWNPELEKHILASDKLLLFWSENSAKSRWVEWEWRQAVKAKGEDVLELHLLRATPMDLVPEELRKYHFNDVYLLARDAELYRREQAAKAAGG